MHWKDLDIYLLFDIWHISVETHWWGGRGIRPSRDHHGFQSNISFIATFTTDCTISWILLSSIKSDTADHRRELSTPLANHWKGEVDQLIVLGPESLGSGCRVWGPAWEAEHGAAVVAGGEGEQVVLVQAEQGAKHKLGGEGGRLRCRSCAAGWQHQSQAQQSQQGLRRVKC